MSPTYTRAACTTFTIVYQATTRSRKCSMSCTMEQAVATPILLYLQVKVVLVIWEVISLWVWPCILCVATFRRSFPETTSYLHTLASTATRKLQCRLTKTAFVYANALRSVPTLDIRVAPAHSYATCFAPATRTKAPTMTLRCGNCMAMVTSGVTTFTQCTNIDATVYWTVQGDSRPSHSATKTRMCGTSNSTLSTPTTTLTLSPCRGETI